MDLQRLQASSAAAILLAAGLGGCGTTYDLPDVEGSASTRATAIFAEEQSPATAKTSNPKPPQLAAAQYKRVVARVEPVAERFCRAQSKDKESFNCDVQIIVDDKMPVRNAYQTYTRAGEPVIALTIPMIADARNEDELAFVLGHEFGHHIAEHIEKQRQQAMAGALIAGVLMATVQAGTGPYYDQYAAQQSTEDAIELGYAAGEAAFSQEYELEADLIGTYIAEAAGYDPIRGARFFARPEPLKRETGQLSFWGTHPPDEERIATVIATSDRIKQRR